MKNSRVLIAPALFGFTLALVTACGSLPFSDLFSSQSTPDQTAPAPAGQPAAQAPRQNATCVTPNYFARVVWQNDQPQMTFGGKPDRLTLQNAPVAATQNPDGSITYQAPGEAVTYARVYADNTCFVQVVRGQNQVVLEESGALGTY
ncbi:MAG: hypothetical protein ACKO7W_18605 [Elainella sp.]